ncbi:MAG: dUTP pyrophosphatase [Candidatus Doudnabacteria bacterium]|nr:dUTP pyrophosphatase [Candidatus Doudnabacteria bacterium]
MQAKIVRLDKAVELPQYHTLESAGFDIASSEDKIIKPKELVLLDTGLIIQAPEGHFLLIAARSSLPLKKGLMVSNGIGVVDRDYCGPEDQIRISVYNFRDEPVEVKKGDRLAQGLFLPVDQVEWIETENIKDQSRGGFGSSGGYTNV